jgi:hypothetical protein
MEKVSERRVGTSLAVTWSGITLADIDSFRAHASLHTGLAKPSDAIEAANGDMVEIYHSDFNEQKYELEYHPSVATLEVVTDPAIPFTRS